MLNPRVGQYVQVWYRKSVADKMPLHGRFGIVRAATRGKPRNHAVQIDDVMYAIPCGNLRPVRDVGVFVCHCGDLT